MTEREMRMRRCCFTGHRTQKLRRTEEEIKNDLETAIKQAIADGYTTFITGMAYGVDIWAGQIIVQLRKGNPELHLIAAIPFPGFEDRWSSVYKREYRELLDQVNLVRYLCSRYHSRAYQLRNEWMVDRSSRVIAVFNGSPSGTKNTLDYAIRYNKMRKFE